MLDFSRQYAPLREEILRAITEVCDSQSFILGPRVASFETAAAAACASAFSIGCGSGTDGHPANQRRGRQRRCGNLQHLQYRRSYRRKRDRVSSNVHNQDNRKRNDHTQRDYAGPAPAGKNQNQPRSRC